MPRPVPQLAFYFAKDVATMLGVSDRKAYDIIKQFNSELEDKGVYIIPGRIRKSYFHERIGVSQAETSTPRRKKAVSVVT